MPKLSNSVSSSVDLAAIAVGCTIGEGVLSLNRLSVLSLNGGASEQKTRVREMG